MDGAVKQQASGRRPRVHHEVKDGTAFWTLSFYISRAQILGHDLALQDFPEHHHPDRFDGSPKSPEELYDWLDAQHRLTEKTNIAEHFTSHPRWSGANPEASLRTLRDLPAFRPRDRATAASEALKNTFVGSDDLRDAINPLFNDIADRSRLGRIEDQLFAVEAAPDIVFVLPEQVSWSTEGCTYAVPIGTAAKPVSYKVKLKRFWYLHGNGAMSWHISFEVQYRDARFARSLKGQDVPHALYLLSLMQKLAYPKEGDIEATEVAVAAARAEAKKARKAAGSEPPFVRSDQMFALRIRDPSSGDEAMPFWNAVMSWFESDKKVIAEIHEKPLDSLVFIKLCPHTSINEIPGLFCVDTRSSFFIRDEQFFRLIQPKRDGTLVPRREMLRDEAFRGYPSMIKKEGSPGKLPKVGGKGGKRITVLGKPYWAAMLEPGAGHDPDFKDLLENEELPDASERLLYLFLAGFNQNIIDWTNQEASEVLDSLDPIYPKSDEQLEEGFFIRYANPRCLISYVQRSRTLEVGNDYIGTCPYGFLIHVLAMHNERLTRDQEKLAFAVVEKVNAYLRAAQGAGQEPRAIGQLVREAEEWINWYRIAAFEYFDRHRYFNPFRYDTERDVFTELERLRGTSRLAAALDKALAALDEATRDIQRVREDAEADRRLDEADKAERHNRFVTLVFGLVGLAGLAQVVLQVDQLIGGTAPFGWGRVGIDAVMTLALAALIPVAILAWRKLVPPVLYLFRG